MIERRLVGRRFIDFRPDAAHPLYPNELERRLKRRRNDDREGAPGGLDALLPGRRRRPPILRNGIARCQNCSRELARAIYRAKPAVTSSSNTRLPPRRRIANAQTRGRKSSGFCSWAPNLKAERPGGFNAITRFRLYALAFILYPLCVSFRAHQDSFGQLCFEIATGQITNVRSIICSITPGGGKSMLPVIAANVLLPAVADRVAWIVPRRSLQEQAETEFAFGRSREILGNQHLIRKTTGESDPCRGLSGFCTTYQAIGANNSFLIEEFSSRRYVLILDEPHHVEEGGAWEAALEPLVKRAAMTVFMSGTLERGNRKRIAFLPYGPSMNGEIVDLSGSGGAASIQYSRANALFDKAITPIHFELMDGEASWIGRDGKTYGTRLSAAGKDTNEAIYTALKTEFGFHLLDECAAHWNHYRTEHPRAKMLAVVANIEDAKKYLEHLQRAGVKCAIATSDDSALAARNIAKFKEIDTPDALGCLVTVAMAYEGLDVPPVTHIACLTHIRSKPWIEQMIARATRFDAPAGPWEEQMAFVYVPDDRLMCDIITRMQDEQLVAIKQRLEEDEIEAIERAAPLEPNERRSITPVGSSGLTRRWSRVGPQPQTVENPEPASGPILTPSQQEAELREAIQTYCKHVDAMLFDKTWGETNKRVVKTFGQSRQTMPLPMLQKVMVWLEEMYPLRTASRK